MGKSLSPEVPQYPYYAGWIPREYAERLITANGEFLVRNTQREKGGTDLVLSAKFEDQFWHYIIFYDGSKYYFKVLFYFILFLTFPNLPCFKKKRFQILSCKRLKVSFSFIYTIIIKKATFLILL